MCRITVETPYRLGDTRRFHSFRESASRCFCLLLHTTHSTNRRFIFPKELKNIWLYHAAWLLWCYGHHISSQERRNIIGQCTRYSSIGQSTRFSSIGQCARYSTAIYRPFGIGLSFVRTFGIQVYRHFHADPNGKHPLSRQCRFRGECV